MLSATSGVPVAENVAGERLAAVAVSVFAPAAVPSRQLPTTAWPLLSVLRVAPERPPPPAATLNVTVTLSTGLPNWSVTRRVGATGTTAFTVTVCVSPAVLIAFAGAPAVPVAEKETAVRPGDVAGSVSAPAAVPSVQLVTRARPAASVTTLATGLTAPPPLVTLKVTAVPGTGLAHLSSTSTLGRPGP